MGIQSKMQIKASNFDSVSQSYFAKGMVDFYELHWWEYIHYFKKKIRGGRLKRIIHVLILCQASFLGSKLFSREIGASTILFEVFWFCCIMGINTQINRKQFVMNDVFFKMKLFLNFSWLHTKCGIWLYIYFVYTVN